MKLAPLRLKKNEERRLKAGHLWVFSNEVDVAATPLAAFEAGQPVEVQDSRGAPLGAGYVNPASLICVRLVSKDSSRQLDAALLRERLERARALREMLFGAQPFYRLAFGESDGLPGLVVDRYDDVLVAQITTAGVERARSAVVESLLELPGIASVQLRNDSPMRAMEGLPAYVEDHGAPLPERVEIVENGARFSVPLGSGQKTGWFYDHRLNRARLGRYVEGRRVLDVFSYIGGWGVQAAVAGAASVVCLDSSAMALEEMRRSAELNAVGGRVSALKGDAFEELRRLRDEGERFDVVVLDPPAFIKRKKDQKQGEQAYQRINELAMSLLERDGFLLSASCSYHMSRDALLTSISRAARSAGRELQILEEGHQAPDHPVHPAIPETAYLKAFLSRAG